MFIVFKAFVKAKQGFHKGEIYILWLVGTNNLDIVTDSQNVNKRASLIQFKPGPFLLSAQ